jgi:gliding motility-associated-like protein
VIAPSSAVWDFSFGSSSYFICNNQSVTIDFTANNFDISNPDATYTWTRPDGTQVSGLTIDADQLGQYTLTVSILGCSSSESISVEEDSINLDITFESGCINNRFQVTALPVNNSFVPTAVTYSWDGTAPFQVLDPSEPQTIVAGGAGQFTVTITEASGCSDTETITVANIGCVIQRGISPNNDGSNDSFDLSAYDVSRLVIFNRYGAEVYSRDNYVSEWFGQDSRGNELTDATYFYVITTNDGREITGWIYVNR